HPFQRAIKLNKPPAFRCTDIAQLKAESIKTTDASTVVVSLPKTASAQAFLSILTFTIGGIVDSKDVKAKETGGDSGSGYLLDHSSGSGPYVVDHWTKNSEVLLKSNPNYSGTTPPPGGGLGKHAPEAANHPAGLAGYNESTPFQADVAKAQSLMKQANQDKVTLELLVPTGPAPGGVAWADLAAKLQADWAKIGVTVNIKQTTQADLLTTYRAQKGQLVMILWGPDFPDPDANVGPFTDYKAKSIAYRNGWDDKIADKGREAALITDTSKRAAAYKDITDYVLHNGPYVILYQPTEPFGLRSNVKGFVWSPMDWTDFASISK